MKKFLGLAIVVALITGGIAFADVQVLSNGTNKGVVSKIDVKGGSTTRTGQTATVDLRSLSGINWDSVGGVIKNSDINWTDFRTAAAAGAGINWESMSTSYNGINWATYMGTATSAQVVCWRTTAPFGLGHCSGGVTGNNCGTCQ